MHRKFIMPQLPRKMVEVVRAPALVPILAALTTRRGLVILMTTIDGVNG